MTWIKRNLFFLIGTLVALALIGAGGFYLWTQMNQESSLAEDIEKQYGVLKDLVNRRPQPGKSGTTNDNVQAAKDQAGAWKNVKDGMRAQFRVVPAITGGGNRFP